jgi:hypothetical protein
VSEWNTGDFSDIERWGYTCKVEHHTWFVLHRAFKVCLSYIKLSIERHVSFMG